MSNQSTGPRTDAGKERSAQNAVKHGMRSERPVLPTEDPAEWDAFRDETVASFEPVGTVEREMAERIALQLWRLRRAARYEAEVCTDEYEGCVADAVDAMHGVDADGTTTQAMAQIQKQIDTCKDMLEASHQTLNTARELHLLPAAMPVEEGIVLALYAYAGGDMRCRDHQPFRSVGAWVIVIRRCRNADPAEYADDEASDSGAGRRPLHGARWRRARQGRRRR